jgi:hypothetical protein
VSYFFAASAMHFARTAFQVPQLIAEDDMPRRATDIRKARNEFVILTDKGGGSFAELCRSVPDLRFRGSRTHTCLA